MKSEMVKLEHNGLKFKMARPKLAELALVSALAQLAPANSPVAVIAPPVGQPWPGQGGINGGFVPAIDDVPAHYLIFAHADVGEHAWGGYREESKATSKTDGKANTEWLCSDETEHSAANACAEHKADGHHDFYLPAAAELYQGWVNCPEAFAQDRYYWSSSQRSADYAFGMDFDDGYQGFLGKNGELRVRPVRRFFI